MNRVVWKTYLGGQILYRSLVPSKKTASMLLFGVNIAGNVVTEVLPGGCGLSKVGTLPDSFEACNTLSDDTGYYVLLCFPYAHQDRCYRFVNNN